MESNKILKGLIWCYFILLLFEGALRKWITPGLSTPLLVVRDPIAILIIFFAYQSGFPFINRWVSSLFIITVLCTAFSFISGNFNLITTGFGIRTTLLHFPLIFIIGYIFSYEDVLKTGKWIMLLGIFMAFLVTEQFDASPDDVLNTTAGGGGRQIETAGGKVRASGTFTYVTGIVSYFAFVTAFFTVGYVNKGTYKKWLLILAAAATLIAMVTSGSRSVVVGCAQVLSCLSILGYLKPREFAKLLSGAISLAILCYLLSTLDIFQEGFFFLNLRIEEASNVEGSPIEAYFSRNAQILFAPRNSFHIPLFGLGFGSGTNAGMAMGGFFGENEWMRMLLESGPIAGNALIFWRVALTYKLLKVAILNVKYGNYLPMLLFGSAGPLIFYEQIGQPTTLGFATFGGGLLVASLKGAKYYSKKISNA